MQAAQDENDFSLLRHDLANLLMTVRGYAELMLLRQTLDPSLRRYPEQIVVAVDRAAAKLDQLRPQFPSCNPESTTHISALPDLHPPANRPLNSR